MYSQERADEGPAAVPEADRRVAELARRLHLGARRGDNWIQLFKFGLVGGSGYVINIIAFTLFVQVLGVHHLIAAVFAFCVAVTNNFALNRVWTFRGTEGHPGFQAARFLAVSLGALVINIAVLYVLADVMGLGDVPAQAIAVATAMPFNFVGNKLWTFR